MVRRWGVWVCIVWALVGIRAYAQSEFKGFVDLPGSRAIYVEYTAAENGRPTVVDLSGLTWSTRDWDPMRQKMKVKGYGELVPDFEGMGKTRDRYAPSTSIIRGEDQVEDLHKLLRALKIKLPVYLNGLSYGGGLALLYAATYPEDVAAVIAWSPYTAPVADQDSLIKSQIWAVRANQLVNPLNPLGAYSDDQLYDLFLHNLIISTYWIAEPEILKGNSKNNLEAAFRLTQGIRKLKAADLAAKFPDGSIHLIVPGADPYIHGWEYDNFWNALPQSKRGSRLDLVGAGHSVPKDFPGLAASWLQRIMNQDPDISGGRQFIVNPWQMGGGAGSSCQLLFRRN